MDLMDWNGFDIRIHMGVDWIWIYGSVKDGLWIGYGSRFQSIRPHRPSAQSV